MKKKKKYFLSLILVCLSCGITKSRSFEISDDYQDGSRVAFSRAIGRKQLVASDLYLYKFLLKVKSNIDQFLKDFLVDGQENVDRDTAFLGALELAGESVGLMEQIA